MKSVIPRLFQLTFCTLLLATLSATNVHAHQPPPCSVSYAYDSYGLGIFLGFTTPQAKDHRSKKTIRTLPRDIEKNCLNKGYQLGLSYRTECTSEVFWEGYKYGFRIDPVSLSPTDSACFRAGYLAGETALHIGARENNEKLVGSECTTAYQSGMQHAKSLTVPQPELHEPLRRCYMTGYYDWGYLYSSK